MSLSFDTTPSSVKALGIGTSRFGLSQSHNVPGRREIAPCFCKEIGKSVSILEKIDTEEMRWQSRGVNLVCSIKVHRTTEKSAKDKIDTKEAGF